jgi:hypothetical protein
MLIQNGKWGGAGADRVCLDLRVLSALLGARGKGTKWGSKRGRGWRVWAKAQRMIYFPFRSLRFLFAFA